MKRSGEWISLSEVCPTCCLPHLLQIMAHIRCIGSKDLLKHCVVYSHCNEVNINFISYLHIALVYILTDKIQCNRWHTVLPIIYTQICLFTTKNVTDNAHTPHLKLPKCSVYTCTPLHGARVLHWASCKGMSVWIRRFLRCLGLLYSTISSHPNRKLSGWTSTWTQTFLLIIL